MNFVFKHQKMIIPLLVFFLPWSLYGQLGFSKLGNSSSDKDYATYKKNGSIGIQVIASVATKANISKNTGGYTLKSHIQSTYDIGLNYYLKFNKSISLITGVHIFVGKRNFFAFIPENDLPGYSSAAGAPLIEDKDMWAAVRIPLQIEREINIGQRRRYAFNAGVSICYSGFMSDESIGSAVLDANNNRIQIFYADLSGRNKSKPWVTILGGFSRKISLDNKNVLCIGLQADLSTTYFYKGTYEITIPGQPVTSGTYKINGTSLGLSVQYVFTGYNKRKVKEYLQN